MKIVYADEKLQLNNSVVVLGNFDGIHLAHQELIKRAVKIAKNKKFTAVVYTFDKHPKNFLKSEIAVISTNDEKEKLIADLGVDVLIYQRIDKDFLKILPEYFIKNILVGKLDAKVVVVGEHYSFGYKASGNSKFLKDLSKKLGVDTQIVPLMYCEGELISSSNIRNHIICGEIKRANELLDRKFEISGEIIHGKSLGTKMGFPTANITLHPQKVVPKYGVYACEVLIDGNEYNAVANIGVKPTFDGKNPLVEIHLIDTIGNFYGKKATVKLCEFIRRECKFDNSDSLKKQIEIDVKAVKEYFLNKSR